MVQLHYDKDEFRLITKKGRSVQSGEKSPSHIKNNIAYSKAGKNYGNPKNRHHVVVKITGGAKNHERSREHLNYVTRNDELPLFDENGSKISLKSAKNETDKILDELNDVRADARRFYNIAFSRHGKTDPELLKAIVRETIQQQFPNNKFYYAVHDDTANTHVHVVIERKGKTRQGKLLEINKKKLNEIKKQYAEIQNKHGLEAVFLSESDKQALRKQTLKSGEENPKREDKRKGANEYIVLDFDKAPYEFKDDGKPSFYLCLQTKNNEKKFHWSWGLQAELQKKGVRIGDKITLKKVRSLDVEKQENGVFKKSSWEINVLDKSQDLSLEQFKVVDVGKAPYKFDETGKPSFYVLMQNHQGRVKDYWGKSLEKMLADKGIKVGDSVIIDKDNPNNFVKQETATQTITQPLEKHTQQQGGFKI